MKNNNKVSRLVSAIPKLTSYRLELIDKIVGVFEQPTDLFKNDKSDIISESVLRDFGDVLKAHHCVSREPFSKDKFEYALERVLQLAGIDAALAPRGQRGFDIKINNQNYSLKTEAAQGIKPKFLHISKFMELGGGIWGDDPDDLIGLRDQFLSNLSGIERILVLRTLAKGEPDYFYELVEIPKSLLEKSKAGKLEMRLASKQNSKPGYCTVQENGKTLFKLYFDGGGERKLQIKDIDKSHCIVHASWGFTKQVEE